MGRILLAHAPVSDVATLSGGDYDAGLPLTNLQTLPLHQPARTSDATTTNTKFNIDFGTATEVPAVIVGPTNLSAAGTFRVRGSSSDTFPDGYDSGWISPGVTASQIDAAAGTNLIHIPASPQTYRYFEVAIDDTTNADGYIDMGRLFVPTLYAPSINYGYGNNGLTFEDRTRRLSTISGVEKRDHFRNRRIMNFAIGYLPESEAFVDFYQFIRTAGFDKTVFVIPDPEATGPELQARSFWGTIGTMDPISQAVFELAGIGLTIREEF